MSQNVDISIDKNDLTCAICLEIFNDPTTLRCGHTYCMTCITVVKESNQLNHDCPTCKVPIGNILTPNAFVKNMVALFKKSQTGENKKEKLINITYEDIMYKHSDNLSVRIDNLSVRIDNMSDSNVLKYAKLCSEHDWCDLYNNCYMKEYRIKLEDNDPDRLIKEYQRREYIKIYMIEYIRFMILKIVTNDHKIINDNFNLSVTYTIDDIWHHHMLIPANYFEFCNRLGSIIEHNPLTETKNWGPRYESTVIAYKLYFKMDLPYNIWKPPCRSDYLCCRCKEIKTFNMHYNNYIKENPNKVGKNSLFCKMLTGKTIVLNHIDFDLDIAYLYSAIAKIERMGLCQFSIVYASKYLYPGEKMSKYLQNESTIHIIMKLSGC